MLTRTRIAGIGRLLAAAALVAGCSDVAGPVIPDGRHLGTPSFAVAGATPMRLDQVNGTASSSGTALVKGFNPVNPHRGDAIIATFFWAGSSNIITSVSDHLTNGTPVGNTYTLVDYVTAGGLSMATYVATNVQNFPGAYNEATGGDSILVVRANLSSAVSAGGVMLSSYRGVTVALGAHRAASGSGASVTTADPGAIPVSAGALVYGVTLANQVTGVEPPSPPFANVNNMSDPAGTMKIDAAYAAQPGAGTVNPQWQWFFNSEAAWLATVLTLDPVATNLVFRTQPTTTLPLATIPTVRVAVEDDLGNTMTSFSGSVTIAIGRNAGVLLPGVLSGTKTVPVVNGIATFADLSIDQPGNGYTLRVTSNGLLGAESAAFNIGAF